MKTINVVAAIIVEDNKFLIAQRGYGEYKDYYEFPGGKIEINETKIEALKREIKEELSVDIEINNFFMNVEYDYPTFHLIMDTYLCSLKNKKIIAKEHLSKSFVSIDEIDNYLFLPADEIIIEKMKRTFK